MVYDLTHWTERDGSGTDRTTKITLRGNTAGAQVQDPHLNSTKLTVFTGLRTNASGVITPVMFNRSAGNASTIYPGPGFVLKEEQAT